MISEQIKALWELVYVNRFVFVFLPLIPLMILSFFNFTRKAKIVIRLFATSFFVILIAMTLQVEIGSPITKPLVTSEQVEALVSKIEDNPVKLDQIIIDTNEEFNDKNPLNYLFLSKDNTQTYWSQYDFLSRDFTYYSGYGKRVDYANELKKNGYFEVANDSGIRVICYPTFYLSVYKFFGIYAPLKPGCYNEMLIIENGNDLYAIICESNTKCSLGLSKYISLLSESL